MDDIQLLNKNDFSGSHLNLSGMVVLECYEGARSVLQIMKPVLQKLKAQSSKEFRHARIDVEQHGFIIKKFHVTNNPTYLVFNDGVLIDKMEGLVSFMQFMETLNKHIGNSN